jgi:hypothetical protein
MSETHPPEPPALKIALEALAYMAGIVVLFLLSAATPR